MNPTSIDLHWITELLAVGACFDDADVPALGAVHGVRAVVDLREEACDDRRLLARHGLDFLHLPLPDYQGGPEKVLARGVEFVRAHLSRKRPVLLHCRHGIGRSALLACCVLVAEGMEPGRALQHARAKRPQVTLSESQCKALLAWACWVRPGNDGSAGALQRLLAISWSLPEVCAGQGPG